jgi:Protein of unknown function (DUF3987)
MNVGDFIQRLTARSLSPQKCGAGWSARCPGHDDCKASLSISTGADGRVLLKCHAGCPAESIVAALGLKLGDLFPPRARNGNHSKPRIVAAYDYHDEDGKLLFQCVRFEPKNFRQRRPDPAKPGEWIWNLKDTRRVLYRLREVKAAIAAGRTLFVGEGEKDCDALAKHGFVATCNPMGAGKWLPEHSATLAGASRVVVIADKDTPGRNHAQAVAAVLHGVAKSVKVIELPDVNGKTVKDAFDFFAAGGTADVLRRLVKAAPEVVPVVEPQPTKPGSAASQYLGAEIRQSEWPELKPLPADLPTVPPFNFACLPDTFRPWIEDIAERMQCPPDFPAVGAMAALGSLVGRKIGIRPKRSDDWLVIPNLWGCVVGRPGLMKTPALEQVLLPLRRLVAEALDRYAAEMREHKVNTMLKSQGAKLAEKKIAGHLKKGDQQAARVEAEAIVNKESDEPVCRRYETNDPTIEKLGVLLAENPTGLLLFRDELVGFLRGLDREGHESDRAIYLEMWNGTGSFTSDRIQRGTVRTPAVLSILGGIQPDLLTAYVREAVRAGQGADGLLQRVQLFVWPDISREWRHVDRWPDAESKNKAFDVFKYLDSLTAETIGADMSSDIPFLRFRNDSQERFDLWRAELEKTLRSDTEHPAFEAHLSKYRKLVPALALLTHLANRGTGAVSFAALDKAFLWATYLEDHARRIYSAVLRPDMAAARELAKHLKRRELPERFTLRETYRKGWAGLGTKEDAETATEILCDLGWIRAVADAGRTTGRPTSPTFETNPKIQYPPRSELTELTKRTSVSFGSEAHPVVEKFTALTEAASELDEHAEVPLIL